MISTLCSCNEIYRNMWTQEKILKKKFRSLKVLHDLLGVPDVIGDTIVRETHWELSSTGLYSRKCSVAQIEYPSRKTNFVWDSMHVSCRTNRSEQLLILKEVLTIGSQMLCRRHARLGINRHPARPLSHRTGRSSSISLEAESPDFECDRPVQSSVAFTLQGRLHH